MRATFATLVCVFGLFLALPPAHGQDDAERARKKKAAEHFARGTALFEKGEYTRAVEAFRLAYEMIPHQSVLGNIGLCYDKIGDWPQAVQLYRRYFADPVASRANDPLRGRLKELEQRMGEILVRTTRETCQVRVDGNDVGSSPQRIVVWPGVHRVDAICSTRKPLTKSISVNARQLLAVDFAPQEDRPAVGASRSSRAGQDEKRRLRALTWTLAGLTVGGVATTAVFGALTLKEKQVYEDSKNTDTSAKERGERNRLISNVALGLTVGLGVTTAVLAFLNLQNGKKTDKANRVALGISPWADAGLVLQLLW